MSLLHELRHEMAGNRSFYARGKLGKGPFRGATCEFQGHGGVERHFEGHAAKCGEVEDGR